jgi:hypothetical protein
MLPLTFVSEPSFNRNTSAPASLAPQYFLARACLNEKRIAALRVKQSLVIINSDEAAKIRESPCEQAKRISYFFKIVSGLVCSV